MNRRMILGGLCLAAMSAGLLRPAFAQQVTAEVLHFWVSGGESKAIKVIADAFNARGGKWIDNAVAGGDAARAAAISRIQGGDAPAAMMWNVGTAIEDLAKQGLLNNVDAIADKEGWKSFLPPVILDRMTVDGHIVAVPVNIHGENWLFWNNEVLAKAGVQPPKTWGEFFAAAEKVKAAGFIPLALGGEPWQEVLAFRAVVAAQAGPDVYREIFVKRNAEAATSPAMQQAMTTFLKLKTEIDPGSPGRSWNDATNMVITGKAAFQIMGDWAKGEFSAANQTAGKEFGCALPPGGSSGYIIAVDVFAFPKTTNPDTIKGQEALASVLMDKTVQTDFNRLKGSVPVRRDISPADFDACGKLAVETLAKPENQLPNAALAMTDDMEGSIEDLITQTWNSEGADPADVLKQLAAIIGQQ